jgi:zinc transport system substrate-binding protein
MTPRTRALLLAAGLSLAACGSDDGTSGTAASAEADAVQVAAAFYPLEFLASRIGGDGVEVESLSPPGGEPHDLELSPQQTARLGEADLVLYLAGFQPAVDDAVAQQAAERSLDVTSVVELEGGYTELDSEGDEHADEQEGEHAEDAHADETGDDPHVWLDPLRFADIATQVAERLAAAAPERAQEFSAAAETLRADLAALDEEYRSGLADCERRQIVTSHNAFGYLARAYDLEQVPVTGLTPEGEPSPGRLAEVAELAREAGTTTIFFEDTASPKVAESLASEVGAEAAVLTPLENAPDDGDYLTAMRENLAALQDALGCSSA